MTSSSVVDGLLAVEVPRCRRASVVHEGSSGDRAAWRMPPRTSGDSITAPARLHLKPGQKGTKRLLAEYGSGLIGVRYRYDEDRKKRFKTVELVIAKRDRRPRPPRFSPDQIVG